MGSPRSHAIILSGLLAFGLSVSVFLGVWDRAEAWTARVLHFLGPNPKEAGHAGLRVLLILGAATLCGWAAGAYRRIWPALAWLLVALFLIGSFSVVMAVAGWSVEPFSSWISALTVFLLVALMHRRVRKRFRLLESADLLDRLGQSTVTKITHGRKPVTLTARHAEVSLVSLVIEAEKDGGSPGRNAALLEKAEGLLLEKGGCLETRAGDHLQVYFGLPKLIPHHGKRACRAALATLAELQGLAGHENGSWGLSVVSGQVTAGCPEPDKQESRYAISGTLLEAGRQLARLNASARPRLAVSSELQVILDQESGDSPTVTAPALASTTSS